MTPFKSFVDKIGASLDRGGSFHTSGPTSSTPLKYKYLNDYRDCASGPSQIILIQRICIAFKGFSIPNIVETPISSRAETLVLS